jgi:hypothetical protein
MNFVASEDVSYSTLKTFRTQQKKRGQLPGP